MRESRIGFLAPWLLTIILLSAKDVHALQPRSVALSNDACVNATVISTVPYADTSMTTTATTDASDPIPSCGEGNRNKSVWYRFAAPSNGTVSADTFDSDYDTILSVYTGSCGSLEPIADGCNDDDPFDGAQSKVSFDGNGGATYLLMVSAYNDDGGTLVFRLRFSGPTPTATATPAPTPDVPGDANCDERLTAADLPAMITLIATGERAPCGRDDATGDGVLDTGDVLAIIGAIFGL